VPVIKEIIALVYLHMPFQHITVSGVNFKMITGLGYEKYGEGSGRGL
jgi:hypothetical protein